MATITTTASLCNSGSSMADVTTVHFNAEAETMIYSQTIMDDFCLTMLRSIDKVSRKPRSYRIKISEAQLREERLLVKNLRRLSRGKDLKEPVMEITKKPHLENMKRKRKAGIRSDDDNAAAEMQAEEEVHVQETADDDDYNYYHHHSQPKKPKKQPRPPKRLMSQAHGPEPPPNMSSELRDLIRSMNGDSPTLIIQKALYYTDLSPSHHRLSMPFNSIRNEFLSPKEKKSYMTRTENNQIRTVEVTLIDPMMRVRKIKFKCWEMMKDGGNKPSSWSYVFGSPWLQVVRDNRLVEEDVLQVWAFRVQSELRFAMVLVSKGNEEEKDSGTGGSL